VLKALFTTEDKPFETGYSLGKENSQPDFGLAESIDGSANGHGQ
jgi:hypothetical protein